MSEFDKFYSEISYNDAPSHFYQSLLSKRGVSKHLIDYLCYHTNVFDKSEVEKARIYESSMNIINNTVAYKKLYSILADEKSRKTLLCFLKFRITGNYEDLHAESDYAFNQYFDKDIIKFSNNEVFVDCGGFIGDTTGNFVNRVDDFAKVYIYEPVPSQTQLICKLLGNLYPNEFSKIIVRNAGVGAEISRLKISSGGAGSAISEKGDYDVSVVSIDEDISEPVSFIKMDVEGFEMNALEGAKKHIISDHPKLAICVYHKPNDLIEIPEYILSLDSSYKLYLRQYCIGESPCETVLYAV